MIRRLITAIPFIEDYCQDVYTGFGVILPYLEGKRLAQSCVILVHAYVHTSP